MVFTAPLIVKHSRYEKKLNVNNQIGLVRLYSFKMKRCLQQLETTQLKSGNCKKIQGPL